MFPNFGYWFWILLFLESSTHSEASPAPQGQSDEGVLEGRLFLYIADYVT